MTVTNKYTKYWDQATNSCRDFVSSPTSNQQWYLVEQHDDCNPVGTSTGKPKDPRRDDTSQDFNDPGGQAQLPRQHQQGHPNDHDEEGGYEADDPLVREDHLTGVQYPLTAS